MVKTKIPKGGKKTNPAQLGKKKIANDQDDDITTDTINARHKLFVEEFISNNLNATKAYIKIYGVEQKTAEANGCRLLSNAKVATLLSESLKIKFSNAEKNGQRVIDTLFELVNRCMQRTPVMIFNYTKKKLEQKVEDVEDPETGEEVRAAVWSFDSQGANKALESLGKYFKLFTEVKEVRFPQIDGININIKKADHGK